MFMSILKAVGFIGGLIVAGISAYSAYKRTTSTNYGSHTMTNSLPNNISYLQALTRRNNPAPSYGYGYGYSASAANSCTAAVASGGCVESVLAAADDELARLRARIAELEQKLAEVLSHTRAAKEQAEIVEAKITQEVPVAQTMPVAAPMPAATTAPAQLPMNNAPVNEATAAADATINANNAAWERDGDRVLKDINDSFNAQMRNTQATTQQMFTPPMSDLGLGALNCAYNFKMNNRFEQFWDSDMYRRLTGSRAPQLPVVDYTTMSPYCGAPNPYSMPVNNPACIALNVTAPKGPSTVIDVPPSDVTPVTNDNLFDERPSRNVEHYGHYGPGMPSTRRSYHFGS